MKDDDYPALYRSSNKMAVKAQSNYLRLLFFSLIFIVTASTLTIFSGYSVIIAVFAATFFIVGLILSFILAAKRYDKTWYLARAVAESIKTLTWRYIMRAEPFDQANSRESQTNFLNVLHKILHENKGICVFTSDIEQITKKMIEIRRLILVDRKVLYSHERIDDQSKWYLNKAKYNQNLTERWFWAITGTQILAIICSLIRVANISWNLMPTGVLATIATAALSWMQIKRFQELSTSYFVTAHDIGLIKSNFEDIDSENKFSEFVSDAENAFSREHTQWQARRDVTIK